MVVPAWLFRGVGSVRSKTHAGHLEYGFKSSGATPMTKAGYSAVLHVRLFRGMLVVCCGIPEDLQMEWGTQSCRSGGDTDMYLKGNVSQWLQTKAAMIWIQRLWLFRVPFQR